MVRACVLIPGYNVEGAIGPLVAAVKAKGLDAVVVNDGSRDNTASVARSMGAHVLDHDKNLGKGAAIRNGLSYLTGCDYDVIITMDGDGQHDPADIDFFLSKSESSQAALLIGNRMHNPTGMPFVRYATNTFMSYLLRKITKIEIPDTQCGFRLIRKKLLQNLALKTNKFEIESEMVVQAAKLGLGIESVPIKSIYQGEKSTIHPVRDTLRFIGFLFKEKS
ncbi:MAG: glycosyltransferase family 2 protein [Candidatus Omnitrophota bacterium]